MSPRRSPRVEDRPAVRDPPTFALEFAFDDRGSPHTVTVFDPGEDAIATHWISIDVDHAVDLADCA